MGPIGNVAALAARGEVVDDARASARAGAHRRVLGIDAARGVAMLFVCFSHFVQVQPIRTAGPLAGWLVYGVTLVASPTFMIISGVMLGFLFESFRDRFAPWRVKLVDRGLFLLVVAHLLLVVPFALHGHLRFGAVEWGFITDVIGVSVLVGALLVGALTPSERLHLAVLAYVAGWVWNLADAPHRIHLVQLRDVLAGAPMLGPEHARFALLPWFGVYLAASTLGQIVARHVACGLEARLERLLAGLGALAVAVGGALHRVLGAAARYAARHGAPGVAESAVWRHLASPWQKYTPGPVYLLLFGGAGVALMAGVLHLARRRPAHAFVRWVSLLGRNSLILFVLQFYVYYVAVARLMPPRTPAWPLWFAASLGALTVSVALWQRLGGARAVTVGLPCLVRRLEGARLRAISAPPTAPGGRGAAS